MNYHRVEIAAELETQLEVRPHQDRRTFRADVDVIEPAVSEQRARAQVLARAHRADLARRDQITIEREDLDRGGISRIYLDGAECIFGQQAIDPEDSSEVGAMGQDGAEVS